MTYTMANLGMMISLAVAVAIAVIVGGLAWLVLLGWALGVTGVLIDDIRDWMRENR